MVKRFQLAGLMRVGSSKRRRPPRILAEANQAKLEARRHAEAMNETLADQSFPDLAHSNAYDAHAEALTSYSPNWQAIVAARAAVAAMLRESTQALTVASDNAAAPPSSGPRRRRRQQ